MPVCSPWWPYGVPCTPAPAPAPTPSPRPVVPTAPVQTVPIVYQQPTVNTGYTEAPSSGIQFNELKDFVGSLLPGLVVALRPQPGVAPDVTANYITTTGTSPATGTKAKGCCGKGSGVPIGVVYATILGFIVLIYLLKHER